MPRQIVRPRRRVSGSWCFTALAQAGVALRSCDRRGRSRLRCPSGSRSRCSSSRRCGGRSRSCSRSRREKRACPPRLLAHAQPAPSISTMLRPVRGSLTDDPGEGSSKAAVAGLQGSAEQGSAEEGGAGGAPSPASTAAPGSSPSHSGDSSDEEGSRRPHDNAGRLRHTPHMAAAKEIDKQEEDPTDCVDDQEVPLPGNGSLTGALGRHLNYSERTKRRESKKQSLLPPIEKDQFSVSVIHKSRKQDAYGPSAAFVVGMQPLESHSQDNIKRSWMKRDAEKPERQRILEEMIIPRKQAVAELERRCQTLAHVNADLVASIEAREARSAAKASTILQQYERSGENIEAVQAWSQRQVSEAREKLQLINDTGTKRLKALEQQLLALNTLLKEAQDEVHTLRNYRDKEYPVHILRIAELKREVCKLQEAYQDEKEDVEALADSEMEKLSLVIQNLKVEILEKIAEDTSTSGRPLRIRHLSHCNRIMAKEVVMLQKAVEAMQAEIASLEEKHTELLGCSSDPRRQMFPDVLLQRPKCPPDMDIVLDIPVERPIPI